MELVGAGKIGIFVHPQKETPGIAAALGRDKQDYELDHCGGVGFEYVTAGESRKDHSYRDSLSRFFTLIASVIGLRMV